MSIAGVSNNDDRIPAPAAPNTQKQIKPLEKNSRAWVTAKKVGAFALLYIALTVGAILTFPVFLFHAYKAYQNTNPALEKLKSAVAAETFKGLKEAAKVGLSEAELGKNAQALCTLNLSKSVPGSPQSTLKDNLLSVSKASITSAEATKFAQEIESLSEWISKKESPTLEDINEARQKIDALMQNPLYEKLKNEKNCYAVNYLQILTIKLVSAKSSDSLRSYAQEEGILTEDDKTEYSCVDLASALTQNLNKSRFYNRDGGYLKFIFWPLLHPQEAYSSFVSENIPTEFYAHNNNPAMAAHTFKLNGKKMRFFYGPTPYGDKIFEGMGIMMGKLHLKHIHISHQDTSKHHKHELVRMQELDQLAKGHPETLTHAVLSLDSTYKAAAKDGLEFTIPELLFLKYLNPLFNPEQPNPLSPECNGVYLPEAFLEAPQVKKGVGASESMISELKRQKNSTFWKQTGASKGGKERLAKMSILATHGMLSLGAVLRSLNDRQAPDSTNMDPDLCIDQISQACKQDIDRGPVENITLLLFYRLLTSDKPLTKEEIQEMAAPILARARILEGRDILDKRIEVLNDLLTFIGENQKVVTDHVRDYAAQLGVQLPKLNA